MHEAEYITTSPSNDGPLDQKTTEQATATWHRITLGLILLFSAFLNFYHLGQNRFADVTTSVNTYYAAAIKSMLMSWHNFFFVAFDPSGFVSIDKPPLGFWIQAASARLFGFSEWSLLLPEALATVASVAVLYILVRRIFGPTAGLIAALALALMPISVVTGRNNTIDSLLVLTLLFATWALSIAAETGRLRWLILSAFLVGLGFNIKMLEAYLVLPAFIVMYLLTAPRSLRVRVLHLALAALVLLVVSFSWITAVDLVPPSQRPYVGSTQTNSELELALGYNGVSRIIGVSLAGRSTDTQGAQTSINPASVLVLFGLGNTGFPGPLRLLGSLLGGQIGWLLLFALFSLIAVSGRRRPRSPITSRQRGLWLWGTWFITLLLFFSVAFFDHAYYMVTFAPAICALVGIGAVTMYQAYQSRTGWRSWLLPIALIVTALTQAYILATYPAWSQRLTPLVVGLSILIALLLIVARLAPRFRTPALSNSLVTASMLTLLIAPAIWSAVPLWTGNDSINPVAGPPRPASVLATIAHAFIPEIAHAQPELTQYLLTHQGQTHYLVATINASTAAPFIMETSKPVMALGGFAGFDHIVTPQQVATMVRQGDVRFFLLPPSTHIQLNDVPARIRTEIEHFAQQNASNGTQSASFLQGDTSQWVRTHCTLVTRAVSEPGDAGPNDTVDLGSSSTLPTQLFDCANAH